jgi:small subunit ribosomal protein S1
MYVCPVSYSYEKGTVVVSHRKYLQALVPSEVEKLRNSEKGATLIGNITGSAKFGIFVEFSGCLTGMIHINDLNEEFAEKLANNQVEPGSEISFMVKEIINDKKIMLTQKEEVEVENPWSGIMERYVMPSKVQGVVKAVKDYGIFVTIEEGIVGLLHISELADIDMTTIKKGDPISVTITRIDESSRKVFLQLL